MSAAPLEEEDAVKLRGTGVTIFRRTPGGPWRVDNSGVSSVLGELRKLGYEEVAGMWQVHSTLDDYLLDLAYFFPGRTPGAGSALALALGDLAPPLVGETVEALVEASFDRYSYARRNRESEVLRGQRLSQREMEQRIVEDLKVDPSAVALRPLVATTENAAGAQWHYGVWGVYRRDANRQPVELAAVYGHVKGGFGSETWHSHPERRDDWNSWRPSLHDFEAIRCAFTGRLTAELFIEGPPEIPGVGEFDELALAKDPTELPQLRVTK